VYEWIYIKYKKGLYNVYTEACYDCCRDESGTAEEVDGERSKTELYIDWLRSDEPDNDSDALPFVPPVALSFPLLIVTDEELFFPFEVIGSSELIGAVIFELSVGVVD